MVILWEGQILVVVDLGHDWFGKGLTMNQVLDKYAMLYGFDRKKLTGYFSFSISLDKVMNS